MSIERYAKSHGSNVSESSSREVAVGGGEGFRLFRRCLCMLGAELGHAAAPRRPRPSKIMVLCLCPIELSPMPTGCLARRSLKFLGSQTCAVLNPLKY